MRVDQRTKSVSELVERGVVPTKREKSNKKDEQERGSDGREWKQKKKGTG